MHSESRLTNDQIDLNSLISILFDNFNIILSIFLSSILAITVYFFSAENLYRSSSLLEIRDNSSSLFTGFKDVSTFATQDELEAEKEIYKSDATVKDALKKLNSLNIYNSDDLPSSSEARNNLNLTTTSKALMRVNFVSNNKNITKDLLDSFNKEFINDKIGRAHV